MQLPYPSHREEAGSLPQNGGVVLVSVADVYNLSREGTHSLTRRCNCCTQLIQRALTFVRCQIGGLALVDAAAVHNLCKDGMTTFSETRLSPGLYSCYTQPQSRIWTHSNSIDSTALRNSYTELRLSRNAGLTLL